MKLTEAVIVIVLYNWAGLREVKPPGWSHTAGNQQKTGSSMSGLQLTRPLGAQFRNISHRKSARAREDAHRMASLPPSKITEGVVLKSQSDLNRCVGKSLFLKPLWDFTFDFLPLPKVHPYPATRPGLSLSVMNVFLSLPLVLPAICLEAGASPWLFQLCIHHINFLEETLTSHRSSGDLASSHTSPWLRSSIFSPFRRSTGPQCWYYQAFKQWNRTTQRPSPGWRSHVTQGSVLGRLQMADIRSGYILSLY